MVECLTLINQYKSYAADTTRQTTERSGGPLKGLPLSNYRVLFQSMKRLSAIDALLYIQSLYKTGKEQWGFVQTVPGLRQWPIPCLKRAG